MKRIIMIITIALLSKGVFAQIQKIICTDDSSVVINNVYLGVLNSVNFSTKEMTFTSPYSLRAAAMVTWHVNKWAEFKTFAVYTRADGADAVNNQFYVNLHRKNWSLTFGKMATPATEIRPLPPTADDHFITWTEAQIPGSALGAKIGYNTSFGNIKIGVAARNKQPEFSIHLGTKIRKDTIHIVGSVGGENKANYVIGLTHRRNRLYQVAAFKQTFNKKSLNDDKMICYFVNYKISKSLKLDCYLDAGYNISIKKSPRLEGGVIKNFKSALFKGLIALGYANEEQAIKGYLFVHL